MATLATMPECTSPTKMSVAVENTPFLEAKNNDTHQDAAQNLRRNESPHWDIRSTSAACDESNISEQVTLLRKIHFQLASQDSPRQFVWNAILQVVYVAMAFLFGLFSIFQWHAQWISIGQATQANQWALLTICLSTNSVGLTYCLEV
jgi:hypothetical protein